MNLSQIKTVKDLNDAIAKLAEEDNELAKERSPMNPLFTFAMSITNYEP